MFKKIVLLAFCLISFFSFSQIEYTLKMSNPQNHYFEVEMNIQGINSKEFEVKMPVWAPGSYLVRDFSKNVNLVRAFNEKGEALKVTKTKKNVWNIEKGAAKKVKVNYEVYAFELTVRTSFLDLTHGFVSGTGIFMYVESLRKQSGKLNIIPHPSFKHITTALVPSTEGVVTDNGKSFNYSDYDELADCPIEIGNQEIFTFNAAGVKHTVAMYGEGNYDIERLKTDMAKVVEASTSVFKENPNKEYVFIIHNVTDGQGGLEHVNSTTLSVNRFTYSDDKYIRFLTLVAHEYFHLWNVKRLRALELGPFNYDEESYTSLLWVMEGFTSYYEDLIVYKAGFMDDNEYLKILQNSINYVEGSEGSRVQPVAHASLDAWIKAYKPNENSVNTTMSYYSRGGLLANLMDLMIVEKFKGSKTLDDFMQLLYKKYYKQMNRGFSAEEFEKEFSTFLGENTDSFFQKYVYGTEIPDYSSLFKKVGIKATDVSRKTPNFGAAVSSNIVKSIRSNSAAEKCGLSVNDEILAVNGYRLTGNELSSLLSNLGEGEKVKLLVARDQVLIELEATNEAYKKLTYLLEFESDYLNNKNAKALLRK